MIDGIFSGENYNLAKKLLDISSQRHQVLASNMANIETPGYRRVDLSDEFNKELISSIQRGDLKAVKILTPVIEEDLSAVALRGDGNNVALDKELLAINRNALEHQFLTQYISGSLKQLKTAITGRSI